MLTDLGLYLTFPQLKMLLNSLMDHPNVHPDCWSGIEYEWAMSKMWYRKQPWDSKKKKDQFNKLLKASPSKAVLSVEQSRKFSRRARMNMISNLTTSLKRMRRPQLHLM